jgi:uncharacterized protein YjbI with pentapeptide repeats
VREPAAPRLDEPVELAVLEQSVENARLLDADASGARVRGLRIRDVVVERGNLANLDAPEAAVTRAAVTGARMTGAQLTRAKLVDVVFRDCLLDLATFAGTTLERVRFDGCRLSQADFREALWRDVRFDACDLTQADLTGLRIAGAELHGCTLDGLVATERLRGAAMPWPDVVGHASVFASALGIKVLTDESDPARRSTHT